MKARGGRRNLFRRIADKAWKKSLRLHLSEETQALENVHRLGTCPASARHNGCVPQNHVELLKNVLTLRVSLCKSALAFMHSWLAQCHFLHVVSNLFIRIPCTQSRTSFIPRGHNTVPSMHSSGHWATDPITRTCLRLPRYVSSSVVTATIVPVVSGSVVVEKSANKTRSRRVVGSGSAREPLKTCLTRDTRADQLPVGSGECRRDHLVPAALRRWSD